MLLIYRTTNLIARLLQEIFPINRSLTGSGVRETLRILQRVADFDTFEVPSGTRVFDWRVPPEWNIGEAYIETEDGERVVDFAWSNLHVVGYSAPVDRLMDWQELEPHLHTLPGFPEAVPYRTSYYNRDWGFCISHEQYEALDRDIQYRAVIDSSLTSGSMTIGEAVLKGSSDKEYLISTYCCHPGMANDNLSGMVLWALLLRSLQTMPHRHTYRFVIAPETIGALAYLYLRRDDMQSVDGGLIPTTVAGPGPFGYKETYQGDSEIDRAVALAFRDEGLDFIRYPFDINGSDERQYSSPAFRIPVGSITKSKYYEYPEYHTSLDNLEFIEPEYLLESLRLYMRAIANLESDRVYQSTMPYGEPMLGRRGLYPDTGGAIKQPMADKRGSSGLDAIRWLLFLSDGQHSLMDIAEQTGLSMRQLDRNARLLRNHDLLEV